MDRESAERIEATRQRVIESLRRTIATLEDLIETNRHLAEDPSHRVSALQRVADGEVELEQARTELARAEAGESIRP